MMKAGSLAAALSVAAAGPIHAKAACDRACLTGFADTYFKALVIDRLAPEWHS
jgi:hypothetical protein